MPSDLPVVEGVAFRLIDGFTAYAVGDNGSVWSKYMAGGRGGHAGSWRRLSLYRRPYGARYFVVCLRLEEGKGRVTCRYVHRLVLEAFVGPCPDGMECLHGDNDTANNHRGNLRWGTHVENTADKFRHGTFASKLNPDSVREIRRRMKAGEKADSLSVIFGVTPSAIHKAAKLVTWGHVADEPVAAAEAALDSGFWDGTDDDAGEPRYQDEPDEPDEPGEPTAWELMTA